MQHRPNPDRAHSEGLPAEAVLPRALPTPLTAPHHEIDMDLTDPKKQRDLAQELHRLLETRASVGGAYTEYMKALQRHGLTDLQLKKIVFTPELQVEIARALSHGNESGRAEAILKTIAQLEGSIHHDALVALADLGSAGHRSVRSCLVSLSRLSRVPNDLFIGQLGARFLTIVGDRRELRVFHDPSDIIKACADFMERRLSFVMSAGEAIPQDLRANAFAETVTFLARDLARGRGLRFGEAMRIFQKHDLIPVVDEVVKRCATSFGGRCKKLLLFFSSPCARVKSLFPIVNRDALARGFREAFLRRSTQGLEQPPTRL